jgi:hypothetical protein
MAYRWAVSSLGGSGQGAIGNESARETLNKSIVVIASEARQSSLFEKSIISGSPRRFAPRDDGFNQRLPRPTRTTMKSPEKDGPWS